MAALRRKRRALPCQDAQPEGAEDGDQGDPLTRGGKAVPGTPAGLGSGPMALRVCLRDVARKAGVAVSTASLALRNDRHVQAATRERVQAAAAELDYRANPHLSSLGRRRLQLQKDEQVPLMLISAESAATLRDTVATLEPHAAGLGYTIDSMQLDEIRDPAAFSRRLYTRGYQGLLLHRLSNTAILDALRLEVLSMVGLDLFVGRVPIEIVRPDYFSAAFRIYRILRERGFRRIGTVLSIDPAFHRDDQDRAGGSYAGLLALPESARLPILHAAPMTEDPDHSTPAQIRAYIAKHRPDVLVFTLSGPLAGYEYQLPELRRLPRASVFVMGSGLDHHAGFTFDLERLCRTAIEVMDRLIRTQEQGFATTPILHAVAPEWNEGTSLKPSA